MYFAITFEVERKYGKNWRTPDKKQFIWNKNKFKEKL